MSNRIGSTPLHSFHSRAVKTTKGEESFHSIPKPVRLYHLNSFVEVLALLPSALYLYSEERTQFLLSSPVKCSRNSLPADIWATNIILQGLPKDIYSLINHYTDAKDIWDNVKMLLEGSELTKEDRESQLYDDFEHFRQYKGETIHDYYVRFAKLINDMRND
ncbi:hypothetical protein Tco_0945465 [Tanacetum coccineum]